MPCNIRKAKHEKNYDKVFGWLHLHVLVLSIINKICIRKSICNATYRANETYNIKIFQVLKVFFSYNSKCSLIPSHNYWDNKKLSFIHFYYIFYTTRDILICLIHKNNINFHASLHSLVFYRKKVRWFSQNESNNFMVTQNETKWTQNMKKKKKEKSEMFVIKLNPVNGFSLFLFFFFCKNPEFYFHLFSFRCDIVFVQLQSIMNW